MKWSCWEVILLSVDHVWFSYWIQLEDRKVEYKTCLYEFHQLNFNITVFYFQLLFSWQLHCCPPFNSAQLINVCIITSQKRFALTNTSLDLRPSMCACNIEHTNKFTFSMHTCSFTPQGAREGDGGCCVNLKPESTLSQLSGLHVTSDLFLVLNEQTPLYLND